MPNGMQIAVSGMLAQQARLDVIAQGHGEHQHPRVPRLALAFQEITVPASGDGTGGGVRALDGGRSSAQGTLQPSENPLVGGASGAWLHPGAARRRQDGSRAERRPPLDGERNLVLPSGERHRAAGHAAGGVHPDGREDLGATGVDHGRRQEARYPHGSSTCPSRPASRPRENGIADRLPRERRRLPVRRRRASSRAYIESARTSDSPTRWSR